MSVAKRRPRGVRIERAHVATFRVALPAPARAGRRRVPERRGALFRVVAGGAVGIGEAAPLPGYAPDELADAHAALTQLAESLSGEVLDFDGRLLERAQSLARRISSHCPSARFAAESALLDLAGQLAGCPLRAWLAPETGRREAARIPLAALVAAHDEREARSALDSGFRALKMKIGDPGAARRDLEAFEALRRAAGDAVELRADANGALPPERAAQILARFEPLFPTFVEEPVALDALPSLSPGRIPLALDESATQPDVWRSLPSGRRLAAVVLKPALLGGLTPCVALAAQARRRGAAPIVSHCFGGPVERAGCVELALALAEPKPAGLAHHPGLAPFAPARDLCGPGPEIIAGDWDGLGLAAREALP